MASAGPHASLHLAPDKQRRQHPTTQVFLQAGCIGADFRSEVPGESSVGLIGGGRGQWLGGGTMASAEHERIMGVWGHSPQRGPGAELLVGGSGVEAT